MPYVKKDRRVFLDPLVAEIVKVFKKYERPNWTRLLYFFCQCLTPSYNTYKNYFAEITEAAAEIRRRHDIEGIEQVEEILDIDVSNEERVEIAQLVKNIVEEVKVDGDLNYIIFAYQKRFLKKEKEKTSFVTTLEMLVEILREDFLAPYEDIKIKENGDVK